MASKKFKWPAGPRFEPSVGLSTYPIVKELLRASLDAGDFDDIESCIVATASRDYYDIKCHGRKWDVLALGLAVTKHATEWEPK